MSGKDIHVVNLMSGLRFYEESGFFLGFRFFTVLIEGCEHLDSL